MKSYIYSLYSAYLGAYDRPFAHEYDPDQMKEYQRRMILTNPEAAFKERYQEKILCVLGTWDDVSGKFEPVEGDVTRIVDLATYFPAGFIAQRIRPEVSN